LSADESSSIIGKHVRWFAFLRYEAFKRGDNGFGREITHHFYVDRFRDKAHEKGSISLIIFSIASFTLS